jgi:hypothetical protein
MAMEWQPESSGRSGWLDDFQAREQTDPAAAPGTAGAKRWVMHGSHGGPGVVASSSHGPHLASKPGQGGR